MKTASHGRQVCLRPLEDDDLDAVVRLYRSTPNYFAAIGYGRESVGKLQLQDELADAQRRDGRMLFAIQRCSDQALVGVADVDVEATMSGTATITLLLIGGPYQRQGYGSEAADLIEQALFAEPEVEFVLAGVAESSELGLRFWQRRGYQYGGTTTHDPETERTTVWLAKKRLALR
jgi:ribosomal protein S18 acetylase RimI-like enzyme